jgi:hypothetical protein
MLPRSSGSTPRPQPAPPSFELARARVIARVQERLDPARCRSGGPEVRKGVRQMAENVLDAELPRMPRPDRDRLLEEVVGTVCGFGPLEELFRDAAVRAVLVVGPDAVLVRRDDDAWVPTNVKFRDEDHLRRVLDRVAAQADPVGSGLPSEATDGTLANGFRAVLVVPPPALGRPATAVFVREAAATRTPPTVAVPAERPAVAAGPPPGDHVLARYRLKVTERITSRMASLGVSDLTRVNPAELRKVVAAYVEEFRGEENVHLTDTQQARLVEEVLTALRW